MKEIDIKEELRVHVARKYKTQTAAAAAWGVSRMLVSLVLKGKRQPNKVMLNDVGFEVVKTTVYRKRREK